MFFRHDSVKSPLIRPYDDSFRVLGRTSNYLIIERNGKSDPVSLDQLKPAYRPEFSSTAAFPLVITVPPTNLLDPPAATSTAPVGNPTAGTLLSPQHAPVDSNAPNTALPPSSRGCHSHNSSMPSSDFSTGILFAGSFLPVLADWRNLLFVMLRQFSLLLVTLVSLSTDLYLYLSTSSC